MLLGRLPAEAHREIKRQLDAQKPPAPAPAPQQEEQKIRYAGEIFEEPKTATISDYRDRIAKVGYLGLARDGL